VNKPDGGPAFPTFAEPFLNGPQGLNPASAWGMEGKPGMSLRDWFAGMAMMAIVQQGYGKRHAEELSSTSYSIADAMIAERAKDESA
jgi:hypothetical protein